MSNIFDHTLRDYSFQIKLTAGAHPFGSPAGSLVDVQTALEQFDQHALFPVEIPPGATELSTGIVEIATEQETNDQIDDLIVITPRKLSTFKTFTSPPTETQIGFPRFSSDAEMAGSNDSNAFTAMKLNKYITNDRPSTESIDGVYKLATAQDALDKIDTTRAMTPLRTREAILSETARRIDATTLVDGVIRLATQGDVMSSTRDVSITPFSLNYKVGSTSTRGLFRLVDSAVLAGDFRTNAAYQDYTITPGTIGDVTANTERHGFTKLVDSVVSSAIDSAVTANQGKLLQDSKVGVTGGTITGILNVDSLYSDLRVYEKNYYGNSWQYTFKDVTVKVIDDGKVTPLGGLEGRPISSYYLSTDPTDPTVLFGGTWVKVSGKTPVGAGTGTDIMGVSRTYNAGNESGTYQVKLGSIQLPTHQHAGWGEAYSQGKAVCVEWEEIWTYAGPIRNCTKYESNAYWEFGVAFEYGKSNQGSKATDHDNWFYNLSPVGKNMPHNNMMPYKAIYMWRRIR